MFTPNGLREQLNAAIRAGHLAEVNAIIAACKAEGDLAPVTFAELLEDEQPSALPLFVATAAGQRDIVASLLEHGCAPDQRHKDGRTPLILAFAKRRFAVADLLLAADADVHAATHQQTRVMDQVLASGDMRYVDLLTSRGVDLCNVSALGNTALHFACRSGNVELAWRVHEASGVGFDQPAKNGRRPIDWCADHALFQSILARYPDIALNIQFANYSWSLAHFAERGCVGIVNQLLDAGCNLAPLYSRSVSLMQHAVESGSAALVASLIARGEPFEGRNSDNYRPLHLAAANGNADIVQLLVQAGAKVNVSGNATHISRETKTPLYMAIENGHVDVARYLVEHGAKLDTLCDSLNATAASAAAALGDLDLLRFLLARGASSNGVNRDRKATSPDYHTYPLIRAANSAVVDLLIENGADVNVETKLADISGSGLRLLVGTLTQESLQTEWGRDRFGVVAALLRHGAPRIDKVGDILRVAKCGKVARLLRESGPGLPILPAAAPVQTEAEYIGFLHALIADLKAGNYGEALFATGLPEASGVGEVLFTQAGACFSAEELVKFAAMLEDAIAADVSYRSPNSYENEETVLHRLLEPFRDWLPGRRSASLPLLASCVAAMLAIGANPNMIDTGRGDTPFHRAARACSQALGHGHDAALFALLDSFLLAGADPGIANLDGDTVSNLLAAPLLAHMHAQK